MDRAFLGREGIDLETLNDTREIQEFYRDNPEMVSSPFGGVDSYLFDLLESIWEELDFPGIEPRKILETLRSSLQK